jgi:hypothetical protein
MDSQPYRGDTSVSAIAASAVTVSPKQAHSLAADPVLQTESRTNNAVSDNGCGDKAPDSDSESVSVSDGMARVCRCGARLEPAQKFCSHDCYSTSLRVPIIDRFWTKIHRHGPVPAHCPHLGPCWLFTGRARMKGGYGQIGGRKNGKRWPMYTHRVAWELAVGPIPAGASVLHKCDVPLCCNPSHLFLGTQTDNLADAREKGRLDETLARIRVFTPEERLAIFEMRGYRGICVDLAHRYGVTKTAISLIRKGRFTRPTPQVARARARPACARPGARRAPAPTGRDGQ